MYGVFSPSAITPNSFTPKLDCFICLIHVFIFSSLTLLCQVLIIVHVNIIHIPQKLAMLPIFHYQRNA